MQEKPFAQKLKNAAAIFTGAAVLGFGTLSFNSCGKLPMHEKMFAPQGQFSEKPSGKELRGSAGGKNGQDTSKAPDGSGIFGVPRMFPKQGEFWEKPPKGELPNQKLQVKPDTAIRK